jgi:hypothetical protein
LPTASRINDLEARLEAAAERERFIGRRRVSPAPFLDPGG